MSTLPLSAAHWCFFKQQYDPREYYNCLKTIGYTGVEMIPPEHMAIARDEGLTIVNITAPTGFENGVSHSEFHKEVIPKIAECIKYAQKNGIKQVIVLSGARKGMPDEEGINNCIKAFQILAENARKAKVVLSLEMLNTYDHGDYHADSSAFGFSVVKAVNSPYVKTLYDVYHMHRMEENIYKDITNNISNISHFHIGGSPKRDFPGTTQAIDYSKVVREAQRAGYTGFWGMEFLPVSDPLEELEEAYKLFSSYQ
jgi:hydroxypyruvate isomerase